MFHTYVGISNLHFTFFLRFTTGVVNVMIMNTQNWPTVHDRLIRKRMNQNIQVFIKISQKRKKKLR